MLVVRSRKGCLVAQHGLLPVPDEDFPHMLSADWGRIDQPRTCAVVTLPRFELGLDGF